MAILQMFKNPVFRQSIEVQRIFKQSPVQVLFKSNKRISSETDSVSARRLQLVPYRVSILRFNVDRLIRIKDGLYDHCLLLI